MCEEANVSGHVTSQLTHFPLVQGTVEAPSSRFLSTGNNPLGSLMDGMAAEASALRSTSLTMSWRACMPFPLLHESPWCPSAKTSAAHLHAWGKVRLAPNF